MVHDAVIIGAGIAGAAIAHELRGRDVLILEAGPYLAGGASGNPKGVVKPWLSLGASPMREFYTAAYGHCLKLLSEIVEFPPHPNPPPQGGREWFEANEKNSPSPCGRGSGGGGIVIQRGILQLPKTDEAARFKDAPELSGISANDLRYLTAAQASEQMQTQVLSEALFWPRGGVIDPAAWVQALIGETPIQYDTHIISLRRDSCWHCRTARGEEIMAKTVYVTTGHAMHLLAEIAAQIRPRRGQITMVPADALPALPHAVSFGHYWIPSQQGEDHMIGATYDHSGQAIITDAAHQKNIDALKNITAIIPVLAPAQNLTPAGCKGRAAVRAATAHHLPLYGRADENLFYLTGLGSRGLMSAPYAARQLLKDSGETGK